MKSQSVPEIPTAMGHHVFVVHVDPRIQDHWNLIDRVTAVSSAGDFGASFVRVADHSLEITWMYPNFDGVHESRFPYRPDRRRLTDSRARGSVQNAPHWRHPKGTIPRRGILVRAAKKHLHCECVQPQAGTFDRSELTELPVRAAELFEDPKGARTEHRNTYPDNRPRARYGSLLRPNYE